LAARLSDVASYDEAGEQAIIDASNAAAELPGEGWLARIAEGLSLNALERLLAATRATVYARATAQDAGFGLETEAAELDGALIAAVAPALETLESLLRPLARLGQRLEAVMEDAPDWLDGQARARVEGAIAGLALRRRTLSGLIALLARLGGPADPDFIDWLAVDRVEGREFDVGIHRRWLDPTIPLAETVLKPAHGVVITSATLRAADGWEAADARTGAVHMECTPAHFAAPSPFDYSQQAGVLIVTDIRKGDIAALSGAYARLIEAARGGALGLFSAINRLKAVHARIADRLAHEGLPLYAQHVDPLDTGTLIDIFRDDQHASLLGTDALRDGVDVPGHSLRLVIMEGVPWPRPTVLHAARRAAGGGAAHDDAIVRARLAQGFGRLIRRASDHGHFIILSPALPSRLLNAFPVGVPIRRVSLAEAAAIVSNGHEMEQDRAHATDSRLLSDTPLGHQKPD
jgi:ATP-dependent DNA helicase DinG